MTIFPKLFLFLLLSFLTSIFSQTQIFPISPIQKNSLLHEEPGIYLLKLEVNKPFLYFSIKIIFGDPSIYTNSCENLDLSTLTETQFIENIFNHCFKKPPRVNNFFSFWMYLFIHTNKDKYLMVECQSLCSYEVIYFESDQSNSLTNSILEPNNEYAFYISEEEYTFNFNIPEDINNDKSNYYLNLEIHSYNGLSEDRIAASYVKVGNVLGSPDYSYNKQSHRIAIRSNLRVIHEGYASSDDYIRMKYWFSKIGDDLYSYEHNLGYTDTREVFQNNITTITFPSSNFQKTKNNILLYIYTNQCSLSIFNGTSTTIGNYFVYNLTSSESPQDIVFHIELEDSNDFNKSFTPSQEDIDAGFTEYCTFFISSTDNTENNRILLGDGIPIQMDLISHGSIKCIYPFVYSEITSPYLMFQFDIPRFSHIEIHILFHNQNIKEPFIYTLRESKDLIVDNVGFQYCKNKDLCPISIEIHNMLNDETHLTIIPKIYQSFTEYIPKNTYVYKSTMKDLTPYYYYRLNQNEKGKIFIYLDKGFTLARYNNFQYKTSRQKDSFSSLDTSSPFIDFYFNEATYITSPICYMGCFGVVQLEEDKPLLTDQTNYINFGIIIQRENEPINAEVRRTIPGALEYDADFTLIYKFSFPSANIESLTIILKGKYAEFEVKDSHAENSLFNNINNSSITTYNANDNIVTMHYNEKNENYDDKDVNLEIIAKMGKNITVRKEVFDLNRGIYINVIPNVRDKDDIVYNIISNKMVSCKLVNGICYYLYEIGPIEKAEKDNYEAFARSTTFLDNITIQFIIIEQSSYVNKISSYFTQNEQLQTYNGSGNELTFSIPNELYVNYKEPLFLFKMISSQNDNLLFGLTNYFKTEFSTSLIPHEHFLYGVLDTQEGFQIETSHINENNFNEDIKFLIVFNIFKGNAVVSSLIDKTEFDMDESSKRSYYVNENNSVKFITTAEENRITIIPLDNVKGVCFELYLEGVNTNKTFFDNIENYKSTTYIYFNSLKGNLNVDLAYNINNFPKDMLYNVKIKGDFLFMNDKALFQNKTEKCTVKAQFITKEQKYEFELGNDVDIKGDDDMLISSYEEYGVFVLNTQGKGNNNENNFFYIGIECLSEQNDFNLTTFNLQIIPHSTTQGVIMPLPQQRYFYNYYTSTTKNQLYLSTSQSINDIGSIFLIEYSSCTTEHLKYEFRSINNNEQLIINNLQEETKYGKQIISFTLNQQIPYIILSISDNNMGNNTYHYIIKYKSKGFSNANSIPLFNYEDIYHFQKNLTSQYQEKYKAMNANDTANGILSEWGLLQNISYYKTIIHSNYLLGIYDQHHLPHETICTINKPKYYELFTNEDSLTLFWDPSLNAFNYTVSLLAFYTLNDGEEIFMNGGISVVENVPSKLVIYLLCGFGGLLIIIFIIFLWLYKQIKTIEKNSKAYASTVDDEDDEEEEIEINNEFDEE